MFNITFCVIKGLETIDAAEKKGRRELIISTNEDTQPTVM